MPLSPAPDPGCTDMMLSCCSVHGRLCSNVEGNPMLPGKSYNPEDILRIVRTTIWVLLVPFALVSAATALIVHGLPDRYRSETGILVVPQRVPEEYVRS